MGEKKRLTEEELAAQQGEPLPNREVMSVITSEPQPLPATGDDIHIHPVEGERTLPIDEKPPPTEGEPMPVIYDEPEPMPVVDDSPSATAAEPDRGPEPA